MNKNHWVIRPTLRYGRPTKTYEHSIGGVPVGCRPKLLRYFCHNSQDSMTIIQNDKVSEYIPHTWFRSFLLL